MNSGKMELIIKASEIARVHGNGAVRRIFGKNLHQLAKVGKSSRNPRKPAPWFRAELRQRQRKARP